MENDGVERDAVVRRRAVVEAARRGDHGSVARHVEDPDDRVRASAAIGLARLHRLDTATVARFAADAAPRVRRALAEVGANHHQVPLDRLLADHDPAVAEMAAWAGGERGDRGADLVLMLADLAAQHDDALVREAAVAALGAIGHPTGLAAILGATNDKATVRRRAVLALAPFGGPEVEAAIVTARSDRDWQVRQAAEELSR